MSVMTGLLAALLPSSEVCGPQELAAANRATFPAPAQSARLVRIGSVPDLQTLLRHCKAHGQKAHIVSRGKNWGFGSRLPTTPADFLIDLSRLDTIIRYDALHGTVRVRPGVSFAQLAAYLKAQGGKHFLSVTGGDPGGSVLGNLLERGDGAGPLAERWLHACAFEVVLADGTLLDLSPGKGGPLEGLLREGPGPGLQDLFVQGNFGVVTAATLWLAPVPRHFSMFQFSLPEGKPLAPVLDHLRDLYARRILSGPVAFHNDYKQVVNATQYPWDLEPQPPLRRATLMRVSNRHSRWAAFGGVYVDDAAVSRAVCAALFRGLRGHTRPADWLSVIDSRKIRWFKRLEPVLRHTRWSTQGILAMWAHNPLLGNPSPGSARSVYWRMRRPAPVPPDPDRDGCGLLWHAFALPMEGALAEAALDGVEQLILAHGFEPVISFITTQARHLRVFAQLIYDRAVEGEEERALACHAALFDWLEQRGFVHTRLDLLHMDRVPADVAELAGRLRAALDSDEVISRGRYGH